MCVTWRSRELRLRVSRGHFIPPSLARNSSMPPMEFSSVRTMGFHVLGCLYGRQKNRRWKVSESVEGL